ncbi:hypothetical protein ACFY4B_26695 [Kitasatospora sp. NPDC001261]|uniref:hypothetical protein n=1 Tax=Kitasatospora sp. NPDC001261 TaxID=3364012 RepID=UPI00369DD07A
MTGASVAAAMPPAPLLDDAELALLRYALLPGGRLARLAATGLSAGEVTDADDRACCLVGAATLVQAGALTAAHQLLTADQIGLGPIPPRLPSVRRTEALRLALGGHTAEQTAAAMDVTEHTVTAYWRARELGTRSHGQAGYAAIATGLLRLDSIRCTFPARTLADYLAGAGQAAPKESA